MTNAKHGDSDDIETTLRLLYTCVLLMCNPSFDGEWR